MKFFISLAVFLLCFCVRLKAETFIVTTNANAGPGSLRQAILNAAANQNTETDYIFFNIAPANSPSDVTITLSSELPPLSSNLVIDATTQSEALLGSSSIKVKLIRSGTDYFSGFSLDGVSDIAIYGFYFRNFQSAQGVPSDERKAGIFLKDTRNIMIGAPGKSNGFGNSYTSIISPTSPNLQENVWISANIMGLDEKGTTPDPNVVGLDLSYLRNSTVGGPTEAHANILAANTDAVSLGALSGEVHFSNNVIGMDLQRTRVFPAENAIGIFASGETAHFIIEKNIIVAQNIGISLDNFKNNYIIRGNRIGIGPDGQDFRHKKYGIELKNCGRGSVEDGNIIAYNPIGVYMELAYPVKIAKNSFKCNAIPIEFHARNPRRPTLSKIAYIQPGNVGGQYLPNSTIDLYYLGDCLPCQGEEWFATVQTDATGNWRYTGAFDNHRAITSMGTNQEGSTAPFSQPELSEELVKLEHVNCGETTGSIKGLVMYDVSVYEWYDANNRLVGTERDLTNVGAGTYRLKAGQRGLCNVEAGPFTLLGAGNELDEKQMSIQTTLCGSSEGSIRGIVSAIDLPRSWYADNGTFIRESQDLVGVAAGIYYFTTGSGACLFTSPRYTIRNENVSYQPFSMQVSPANCGQDNGGIHIPSFNGSTPIRFEWLNAQGQVVGREKDLQQVPEGKYRLRVSDGAACEQTLQEVEIPRVPVLSIDLVGLRKYLSCDQRSVSARGLSIKGGALPYAIRWTDEQGRTVFSDLLLSGVTPGKYTMHVRDKLGCEIQTDLIDFTDLSLSGIHIPNAFSPNGDGINDEWKIEGMFDYPEAEIRVYNREGREVYVDKGGQRAFDGSFQGKPLPTGTYYYYVDLKGNCEPLSGSLFLIR